MNVNVSVELNTYSSIADTPPVVAQQVYEILTEQHSICEETVRRRKICSCLKYENNCFSQKTIFQLPLATCIF